MVNLTNRATKRASILSGLALLLAAGCGSNTPTQNIVDPNNSALNNPAASANYNTEERTPLPQKVEAEAPKPKPIEYLEGTVVEEVFHTNQNGTEYYSFSINTKDGLRSIDIESSYVKATGTYQNPREVNSFIQPGTKFKLNKEFLNPTSKKSFWIYALDFLNNVEFPEEKQ